MNKVVLMGRLTKDPEVRYSQRDPEIAIARFFLAVDRRRGKTEGGQTADFISCVAFGKSAEHAKQYYRKGMRICISGRLQTGSYEDANGRKVYTTDVVVEDHEFAESKKDNGARDAMDDAAAASYGGGYGGSAAPAAGAPDDGFAPYEEELPFT